MKEFNSYLNNLDYSLLKDLFARKGILRTYHKKDFFIRQNEVERFADGYNMAHFNIRILTKKEKNTL